MKIKEVLLTLERFAPLPLQEDYDNAGLQIGLTAADVSGVLLCLDVTEEVMAEAVDRGCNLVVAHHPLLFRGLKRIAGESEVERCVTMAIKNDIAIYAAHTNLDNAIEGVNWEIARRLDATPIRPLCLAADGKSGAGLLCRLNRPQEATAWLRSVKDAFAAEVVMHNRPMTARHIETVAICGGAGDFLLGDAIAQGADAFLTGEMHYHQYFGHDGEIQIAVIGHYESEQFTVDLMARLLSQAHPELRIKKTTVVTNPIYYAK